MSSDYARMKAIYLAAADLEGDARATFLDRECGDDGDLRSQVEGLLGYEDDPRSLEILPEEEPPPHSVPAEIGGYRIVRLIGQGGMGVVYEAEQDTPRRTVALKVLRTGLDGAKARRRFQLEAELLGRLRHPGIAQIHEAEFGDPGSPAFIVMEYVDGRTITDHCRFKELSDDERLELWASVADAIQHAHAQGLVHRDIKPGNVLVDAAGRPKVLDFGVARVLDEELRSKTLQTHSGEVVGTVSYMSPEQASGAPDEVDARSDVYALGVLGYELLTGELPHELRGKWLHEAVNVIRDDPPVRPRSRRVGLANDIETILLKALEKEKRRRYQSADALAEDIRRFLAREPISAHPPSSAYQLRMFARRHRYLVGSTIALVLILVAGLWGTIRYALRADDATTRAIAEKERAERTGHTSRMRAIAAAVDAGRAREARVLLDEIPPVRRGWEWRHFVSRLDNCELLLGEDEPLVAAVGFRESDGALATMTRAGLLELRSPTDLAVVETRAFGPGVVAFAISDDRTVLLRKDGRLEFREGATLRTETKVAPPITRRTPALSMSRDGATCVVQVNTGAVCWHLESNELVKLGGSTRFAAISPNGEVIAGGKLRLFDPRGATIGRFPEDVERLRSGAFSCDGRLVAFGTQRPSIYVMNTETMRAERTIQGLRGSIEAVEWTPDGKAVVSGDDFGDLHVWDIGSGRIRNALLGHAEAIHDLAVSHDGSLVAAATMAGRVRLWKLDGPGDVIVEAGDAEVTCCAFSPDATLLVTGDIAGTLRFWDGSTNKAVATFPSTVRDPRGLAWSSDGTRLIVSSTRNAGLVSLGLPPSEDRTTLGLAEAATGLLWPGRLTRGRGVSASGALHLRSATQSGKPLRVFRSDDDSPVASIANDGRIRQAAFSRDGRWLALARSDGVVAIHDGTSFALRHELTGHESAVVSLAFSPDGRRLASGGVDQTIRLWDLEHFYQTAILEGHLGSVWTLTFSCDGTRLVSGSRDRTFRVWAAVPRRELVAAGLARRKAVLERTATVPGDDVLRAWRERGDPAMLMLALERGLGRAERKTAKIEAKPGSAFGASLAVLAQGPELAVGSPFAARGRGKVEAVSLYEGQRWSARGKKRGEQFGVALLVLPDLDGDGTGEIVVGAPGRDGEAGRRCGGVMLLSGRTGEELWSVEGRAATAGFGGYLALGADHDGDGVPEVIAASRKARGPVRILSMKSRKELASWDMEAAGNPPLHGLPDVDDDGIPDVALVDGDHLSVRSFASGGEIGRIPLRVAPGRRTSTALLPDRDGDGIPEVVVTYQGSSAPAPTMLRLSRLDAVAWTIERRPTANASIAPRVRTIADLDRDGTPEIVVWSSWRRPRQPQTGPALTIISGRSGEVLAEVPTPLDSNSLYGASFAITDANGDGRLDVIVSSPDSRTPRIEMVPLEIRAAPEAR